MNRVYLDHAATSWPRLPGVVEALSSFEANDGAAAGRGGHSSSTSAAAKIERLRLQLARLINNPAEGVAFFANGTAANNFALAGVLRSGDHVVTTQAEHNSVLRPLRLLMKQRGITWSVVPVDGVGRVDPQRIEEAIRVETKLLVCTAASNVTGACNDLAAIGAIAKKHNLIFMVDAAQSFGYVPIDMSSLHIDILASPGHKGGGGPLGTGVLAVHPRLFDDWQPLWIGGTGEASDEVEGDFHWKDIAESGNRNTAALVGWLQGLEYLVNNRSDTDHILRRNRLLSLLHNAPCGKLIGHQDDNGWVDVFSLNCGQSDAIQLTPIDWAAILDSTYQIEVRAGFHCAALVHDAIGTHRHGGTLRFSIGHTTTDHDLDMLETAFKDLRDWKG